MKEKIKKVCITNLKKNWKRFVYALIVDGIVFCFAFSMGNDEIKRLVIELGSFSLYVILLSFVMPIVLPILLILKDHIVAKKSFDYDWWDKEIDFTRKSDIEYCRELTEVESPLLINRIYGGEATKNVVVAELLSLEKRGIIRFSDNKISVVKRGILLHSERAFMRFVIDGKVKINNVKEYMDTLNGLAKLDLETNKKYYHFRKRTKKEKVISNILSVVAMSVLIYFAANLFKDYSSEAQFLMRWWQAIICALVVLIVLYYMNCFPIIDLVETPALKNLKKQIKGLERFLKEYSMLEERSAKEIEIWEEYLIYSVLFGHNKKVVEEYEKYIEVDYNA